MNSLSCKDGMAEGERRKQDALASLAERRDVYVNRGRRALLARLLEVGTATADDVRSVVELPPGVNPTCFGSVPSPLAQAGVIYRAGYRETTRPEGHARPVTVWRLADREAAERWLRLHPDRPDPSDESAEAQGLLFPLSETQETPSPAAATTGPGMEAI